MHCFCGLEKSNVEKGQFQINKYSFSFCRHMHVIRGFVLLDNLQGGQGYINI